MPPVKPRATLRGCVLTLLFVALLGYGAVAGVGYAWFGPGFGGALAARHAPERVRAASTTYVYDRVIVVERERVVFRDALWPSARRGVLAAMLTALVTLLLRRRLPRLTRIMAIAGIGLLVAAVSYARRDEVSVPRGASLQVEVRPYERGGGRSGTRQTTAWEKGWEVVLADGTRLVRLPWNEEGDARVWQQLIGEKIGTPAPHPRAR